MIDRYVAEILQTKPKAVSQAHQLKWFKKTIGGVDSLISNDSPGWFSEVIRERVCQWITRFVVIPLTAL